ncbi:MAG: dihydropteroate synthase [Pseudomonadota bacterium]
MTRYVRPVPQTDPARPHDAYVLAGGWCWFTHVELLERGRTPRVLPASHVPPARLEPLIAARPPVGTLAFHRPSIMGIINATPDSFSDGGKHLRKDDAMAAAAGMAQADILDVGGESTRPGAQPVSVDEEIQRILPLISALRSAGVTQMISVDTRKAVVAEAALSAGADLVNDVSGFKFDKELAPLCGDRGAPVCVMHAQGDPETMQDNPHYDDVLLDVYDALDAQIRFLEENGVPRARIIADPGIGFGKTLAHNMALLARLSLFHGLGVPILLGASRKGFIGKIADVPEAQERMPGSISVALAALKHGTQIVRVHDVPETAQAIALWQAVVAGNVHG